MSLSINPNYYYSNYSASDTSKVTQGLSSGKRINSAADDAAGLAIAKNMENISGGLDKATNNAYDMKNLLNVAEGSLSTISDSIERIRELTIQSANSTYTNSDRALMQAEVDQLIEHIGSVASNAQFNQKNLIDGSFTNQHAAVNSDGTGQSISIADSTIAALGLTDYSLMGGASTLADNIKALDNAQEAILSSRAEMGAQSNRLESTIRFNDTYRVNMEAARSRIEDQDIAEGMMELTRKNALSQYSIFMQKNMMQNAGNFLSLLG